MGVTALAAVGLSAGLDATVEELPSRVHPVALFGHAVGFVDREWAAPLAVGTAVAAGFPLAAAAVAWVAVASLAGRPVLAAGVGGLALFSVTSLRMLVSVARRVVDATEDTGDRAHEAVVALVGRDTADLSPGELRSAAVESAAENLADGLVAPLLAFAVGAQVSLAVGVAAATWVKAVNTLDSMLGYRSKPVGRASARLDDAVMWVPARATAAMVAVAAVSPGAVFRAREWSDAPASPNAGWPMATLAAVVDAELAKPGHYRLNPGAGLPTVAVARRGIRVVTVAGGLAFVLAGVIAWP